MIEEPTEQTEQEQAITTNEETIARQDKAITRQDSAISAQDATINAQNQLMVDNTESIRIQSERLIATTKLLNQTAKDYSRRRRVDFAALLLIVAILVVVLVNSFTNRNGVSFIKSCFEPTGECAQASQKAAERGRQQPIEKQPSLNTVVLIVACSQNNQGTEAINKCVNDSLKQLQSSAPPVPSPSPTR